LAQQLLSITIQHERLLAAVQMLDSFAPKRTRETDRGE